MASFKNDGQYKELAVVIIMPGISKYDITPFDLKDITFAYRIPQGQYQILENGDYEIKIEGYNQFIVITNAELLLTMETIQLSIDQIDETSTYNPIGDPDITVLVEKYNVVVENYKELRQYVDKHVFIADTQETDRVLPQLDIGEVWVKVENGWAGYNIGDIDTNLKQFWIEFDERTEQVMADIETEGNTQVKNVQDASTQTYSLIERQWKMYSIVTGANRYLSGNILDVRDNLLLDREVNGKSLEDRATLTLRREYNGGRLEDRALSQDLVIDLGEAGGGA